MDGSQASGTCVHCGEPLGSAALAITGAQGIDWVCCAGCRAMMLFLEPAEDVDAQAFADWDRLELLAQAQTEADGQRTLSLAIDAIHCPNCAWLIERHLHALAPSIGVSVDVPFRLLHLTFDPTRVRLSQVIAVLAGLHYPPRLVSLDAGGRRQHKRDLKALFVAAFCAMQAMMFAEPLYWAAPDLPSSTALFFAWISALITLPVVAYAGGRFFRGAMLELRTRRPAMDTLISSAISLALIGSFGGLLRGSSAVYFDAIAMFVFVLLLGRVLEARLLAGSRIEQARLLSNAPALAELTCGERLPLSELALGMQLRAFAGETLLADGVLLSECALVSEALLDGESTPCSKRMGDSVLAGSCVQSAELIYKITALGSATQLAQIAQLSRRAAAARAPDAARAAQMATRFTLLVLVLAVLTSLAWWLIAPERALAVTLSVLTVACPCALGLALPLTRALAHARLQSMGVLLLKPDALARLAEADHALLDKTGTLTTPHSGLPRVTLSGAGSLDIEQAREIAGALEHRQNHPLAHALAHRSASVALAVEVLPGAGLRGVIAGELWTLGRPALFGLDDDGTVVLDGPRGRAFFDINESIRPGVENALAEMRSLGLDAEILSGDSLERVARVGRQLGISTYLARQSPAQKRAHVQACIERGQRVLMLGDGINDAVALAQAHVGVSFACGSALAQTQADVLLLKNDLNVLAAAIALARRSEAMAVANLRWAQLYNLLAIPAAALGLIGPGWAALGMGLSSLLVTANACRLLRNPRKAAPQQAQVLPA